MKIKDTLPKTDPNKPTRARLRMQTQLGPIGKLTKEQLQLLLSETLYDLRMIDKNLAKAYKLIENCLP